MSTPNPYISPADITVAITPLPRRTSRLVGLGVRLALLQAALDDQQKYLAQMGEDFRELVEHPERFFSTPFGGSHD